MICASTMRAVRYGGVLAALLAFSGCAHPPAPITVTRPVEVPVPVPVACAPPAELTADLALPQPQFRTPNDAGVTSGLLPADESALMTRDALLRQRIRGWEAWGGCSAQR